MSRREFWKGLAAVTAGFAYMWAGSALAYALTGVRG